MSEQYEKFEIIGEGRHTTVYEGHDHGPLDRPVAIKELSSPANQDPRRLEAFLAEAKLLAHLDHEHLMKVLDVVQPTHLVITELLAGSLDKLVENQGPISSDRVRSIVQQVLKALHYLHQQNVLYGKIRPSKILYNERGKIKLSSFEKIDNGLVPKPEYEKYVAPETLATEFGEVGPPLDFYCLGFSALELLLGKKFDEVFPVISGGDAMSNVAWLRWHSSPDPLPPVKKLVPRIASDLAIALDAMLKKPVAQRPQTALAVFELLAKTEPIPILDGVEQSMPFAEIDVRDGEYQNASQESKRKLQDRAAETKHTSQSAADQKTNQDRKGRSQKRRPNKHSAVQTEPTSTKITRPVKTGNPASVSALHKTKAKTGKKTGSLNRSVNALALLGLLGAIGFGGWWTYTNDPFNWFATAQIDPERSTEHEHTVSPDHTTDPVETINPPKIVEPIEAKEPENRDFDKRFQLGIDALGENKHAEAIEHFSVVLGHDPAKYLLAFLLRAQAHHHRNSDDHDQHHAVEDLTTFLNQAGSKITDIQKADAHLLRARIHRLESDLDESIVDYRAANRLRPEEVVQAELTNVLLERGDRYLLADEFSAAISDFEAAIQLSPSSTEIHAKLASAHNLRGKSQLISNNIEAAKKDFDRSIELAPEQSEAYALRGHLFWKNTKEPNNAIDDFQQALQNGFKPAIELHMALADIFGNRGLMEFSNRNFSVAVEAFSIGLQHLDLAKKQPNLTDPQRAEISSLLPKLFRQRGDCYYATQDYTRGIEQYSNAIEASTDTDHIARARRGNCYKLSRKFEAAEHDLRRAIAIDGSYSIAHYYLAQLLIKSGQEKNKNRFGLTAKEQERLRNEAIASFRTAINELKTVIGQEPQPHYFDLMIAAWNQLNLIDTNETNARESEAWIEKRSKYLANN